MTECVPYRLDRMVSPDQLNGIGQVVLANCVKLLDGDALLDVTVIPGP